MRRATYRRWRGRVRLLWRPDQRRAVWWAWTQVRRVQRELPVRGLAVSVDPPPFLPDRALRGVLLVTGRLQATCLERSLVLQSWLHHHGRSHDVLIGVASPEAGFAAHAWVEGWDDDAVIPKYTVIKRLAPR